MLASRIIGQARILLSDPDAIRWPDPELLGWLNGGQLQVVAVRPDAGAKKIDHPLVLGTEQAIPANGTKLLDVIRNVGGRAVTLISRDQLSALDTGWFANAASAPVRHFTFDENDPKAFHVYPPATAGSLVRLLYTAIPLDCADLSSPIALDDIYEGPLIDWVCYRAWLKDDEVANASKAANALNACMLALTGKSKSDESALPKRK